MPAAVGAQTLPPNIDTGKGYLLGPGDTLGGAIAQALIAIGWRGLRSKQDFQEVQASDSPFLLAMGREDQRALVTG